jgi:hypothetical protein
MDEIERLAPGVRLADPDGIREYLSQYPELVEVVPLAVDAARRHFPEAQLVLDVYKDPEIDDRYLVLYFRLRSYTDFVDRLEEAQAEFLPHLRGKRGWIQLTTDFREPEEDGR